MTFGNKNWYDEEVQKWLWPHGFLTFRPINAETIGYLTQYVQNPSDLHQQNSWSNGLGKQGLWYLLDIALQKAKGSSNWDMHYNINYIQWGKNKFSLDQTQRKWFDQWLETNKLQPNIPNLRLMEEERKIALLSPFPDHETIQKEIQYFQRSSGSFPKRYGTTLWKKTKGSTMTDKLGHLPAYISYRDIHGTNYSKTEEGKQSYYIRMKLYELEFPFFMRDNQRPPK